MNRIVIAAALSLALVTAAAAAPKAPPPDAGDQAARLSGQFAQVCASHMVLSAKAKTACDGHAEPRALKSGVAYRNQGVGAEFNALIRQLPAAEQH